MAQFITVSTLIINVEHIVYIRERASDYEVVVSSHHAQLHKPDGQPYEYGQVENDRFYFTKGRPETQVFTQWMKYAMPHPKGD